MPLVNFYRMRSSSTAGRHYPLAISHHTAFLPQGSPQAAKNGGGGGTGLHHRVLPLFAGAVGLQSKAHVSFLLFPGLVWSHSLCSLLAPTNQPSHHPPGTAGIASAIIWARGWSTTSPSPLLHPCWLSPFFSVAVSWEAFSQVFPSWLLPGACVAGLRVAIL